MRYNEIKPVLTEGALSPGNLSKYGPDDPRLNTFVNKITNGTPFELETGGTVTLAKPKEFNGHNQNVIDRLKQAVTPGKLMKADGTIMSFGSLTKTTEFGGQTAAAGEIKTDISNRGNVMEGVLGAATAARLMKRPGEDISVSDIIAVIKAMPPQSGKVTFPAISENNVTDKFELTVMLDAAHYEDFINVDLLQIDKKMSKYLVQVANYCNSAAVVDRYASFFENNARPDVVKIVADGITDNTGAKTDIVMQYVDDNGDRKLVQFDISLKAGTTPQFGQAGGGSGIAPPSEDNFTKLNIMFDAFGIDIADARKEYLTKETFNEAYIVGYKKAADIINNVLSGADEDKETKFMQKFINGIKFHGTRNVDSVKILQFEENKFYLLDFSKLDRLFEKGQIDLAAKSDIQGNGLPVLVIYNKALPKKNVFISIRPKPDNNKTKTIRNLIQKGPELKRLTVVRSTTKLYKKQK